MHLLPEIANTFDDQLRASGSNIYRKINFKDNYGMDKEEQQVNHLDDVILEILPEDDVIDTVTSEYHVIQLVRSEDDVMKMKPGDDVKLNVISDDGLREEVTSKNDEMHTVTSKDDVMQLVTSEDDVMLKLEEGDGVMQGIITEDSSEEMQVVAQVPIRYKDPDLTVFGRAVATRPLLIRNKNRRMTTM